MLAFPVVLAASAPRPAAKLLPSSHRKREPPLVTVPMLWRATSPAATSRASPAAGERMSVPVIVSPVSLTQSSVAPVTTALPSTWRVIEPVPGLVKLKVRLPAASREKPVSLSSATGEPPRTRSGPETLLLSARTPAPSGELATPRTP